MASLEDIKNILVESQQMWAQAHKELLAATKTKATGTKAANEKESGGGPRMPDMSGIMPTDLRQIFSQFSTTLKQIFGGTNLSKFENTLKLTLGQMVGNAGSSTFKRMLGTAATVGGAAAANRYWNSPGTRPGMLQLIHKRLGPNVQPQQMQYWQQALKNHPQLAAQFNKQAAAQLKAEDPDDDQKKQSRWTQFRKSLFQKPTDKRTSFDIRRLTREGISNTFSGQGPLGAIGKQYRAARVSGSGQGMFSAAVKAPFRAGGRALASGASAARAAGSAAWAGRAAGVMGAARGGMAALGAGASAGGGTAMAALGLSNPVGWAVLAATAIPAAVAALVGFSNAVYKSQEALKEFSGGMARTFAKSEIREFKRNLASAKAREGSTAWLGDETEKFKDTMRPVWDTLFNIMASILAAIMHIINWIASAIAKIGDLFRWVWDALPDLITGGKEMPEPDKVDLGPLGNMLREFGMGRSDKWQDKTLFNWGGI